MKKFSEELFDLINKGIDEVCACDLDAINITGLILGNNVLLLYAYVHELEEKIKSLEE